MKMKRIEALFYLCSINYRLFKKIRIKEKSGFYMFVML
ncbi:hypothetical protein BSPA14S_H0027 (plasmid) [Borreliella spielmanii A14S]|uniref:Uncharacterized protein n=1 Tax=Borreliella spielmanii A14S TaxID=498742 RepID=C0RCF3_9SPIR|nr:hypothetical protein BSPA14S_H0027 [Borreliella spielmanii A14S]